jgi:hypothetical protein
MPCALAVCVYRTPHSRTVPSSDPEARILPSGEKATLHTVLVCPERAHSSRPLATSHSLTVLSLAPEANVLPSGEKATLFPACSERTRSSRPPATSHSLMVKS